MSDVILYLAIASLALALVVALVLLRVLNPVKPKRRNAKRCKKSRRIDWAKFGAASKRFASWLGRAAKAIWGAFGRFFRWLKKNLPKRKRQRKALRVHTPAAPPPSRAKTSGWVIAIWVFIALTIVSGVILAIMLLLPFFALFLVAPVSPEVQQQMDQAFAVVPHETVSEIAELVLRFVIGLLGGRLV
jgi:hypothetical protein